MFGGRLLTIGEGGAGTNMKGLKLGWTLLCWSGIHGMAVNSCCQYGEIGIEINTDTCVYKYIYIFSSPHPSSNEHTNEQRLRNLSRVPASVGQNQGLNLGSWALCIYK